MVRARSPTQSAGRTGPRRRGEIARLSWPGIYRTCLRQTSPNRYSLTRRAPMSEAQLVRIAPTLRAVTPLACLLQNDRFSTANSCGVAPAIRTCPVSRTRPAAARFARVASNRSTPRSPHTPARFATKASRSTSRPPSWPPPPRRSAGSTGNRARFPDGLGRQLRRPAAETPAPIPRIDTKIRRDSIGPRICFTKATRLPPPTSRRSPPIRARCRQRRPRIRNQPDRRLADRAIRYPRTGRRPRRSSAGRSPTPIRVIGTRPSA